MSVTIFFYLPHSLPLIMFDLVLMAASGTYCYVAKKGVPDFKEAELPVKAAMVLFGGAAVVRVLKVVLGRPLSGGHIIDSGAKCTD